MPIIHVIAYNDTAMQYEATKGATLGRSLTLTANTLSHYGFTDLLQIFANNNMDLEARFVERIRPRLEKEIRQQISDEQQRTTASIKPTLTDVPSYAWTKLQCLKQGKSLSIAPHSSVETCFRAAALAQGMTEAESKTIRAADINTWRRLGFTKEKVALRDCQQPLVKAILGLNDWDAEDYEEYVKKDAEWVASMMQAGVNLHDLTCTW